MSAAFRTFRRVSSVTLRAALLSVLACCVAGCGTSVPVPTALPRAEPLTIDSVFPPSGRPGNPIRIYGTGLTGDTTAVAVTLTALTTDVRAGDPVSVTWSAPRAQPGDFVAFVAVGSSATPYDEWGYDWEYTKGAPTGTWHFRPPPSLYPPGQYEFRFGGGGVYTGWATESIPVTIR